MRSEFFIALVADGTPFDAVAHKRRDLDLDETNIVEQEAAGRRLIALVTDAGDPGIAMLDTFTWCHVSREKADGTLVRLGTGYIDPVSIQHQDHDLVSLEVLCSPRNWDDVQAALLAPLKVLPTFDPVLVDPLQRNDPVEILDGRSAVVHCHPVTHEMTVVDIFGVGLPTVEVSDPDFPGPQSTGMTRPVSRVDVSVSAEWIEKHDGRVLLGGLIEDAFDEEIVNTLTPDAFENSWPKPGAQLNGNSGYTVRKSRLERTYPADEDLYPPTAGPVRGSSAVYNYVQDADLMAPEAQEINLERAYYDVDLDVDYAIRQKRVEIARFSLINGAPTAAGGSVEILDLKCGDVTLDETTLLWEPDTDYDEGDIRRVGTVNWVCEVDHHSGTSFPKDVFYHVGGGAYAQRWTMLETDASPIGNRGANSFFLTARGGQTIQAAVLKARAIVAASIRNKSYRFETELTDDLLTLTTASKVRVRCLDQPGGWLEAKVIELEIVSNADDEHLAITLAPAGGSGVAVAGDTPLSQTGEAWDRIYVGDFSDQTPDPVPAVAAFIEVENTVDDQLAYVSENDYSPADGRTDPKANDPLELLRDRPTGLQIILTQISGRDAMVHEIEVPIAAAWSGPKQHGS